MSTKTIIHLIDDLTGEPADETLTISLDGRTVVLDLCAANAENVRHVLGVYLDAGRPVRTPRAVTSTPRSARKASGGTRAKTDQSEARTWARSNGWPTLADRGRMPADALAAYRAAHTGGAE
jgi:hypothetical protein